jgi:hypothetical protein
VATQREDLRKIIGHVNQGKLKVKLSLNLIKHYALKAYGGVDV